MRPARVLECAQKRRVPCCVASSSNQLVWSHARRAVPVPQQVSLKVNSNSCCAGMRMRSELVRRVERNTVIFLCSGVGQERVHPKAERKQQTRKEKATLY